MSTKREFFAADLGEAKRAASRALGVPVDRLRYEVIEGEFGSRLDRRKIAIVVEYDEQAVPTSAPERPESLLEERRAREAGDIEWAKFLLEGLLERLKIKANTSHYQKGEHVVLTVQVLDGDLDWRRGECRELRGAIQHIINRAISQGREVGRRFIIDIGGTLESRTQQMAALADELAGKVESLGRAVHIHLMDSQDRRLLHLEVVERDRVRTESTGDKQFRVLCIEPKKTNPDEDQAQEPG